jgi:hypothetical protein
MGQQYPIWPFEYYSVYMSLSVFKGKLLMRRP